MPIAIYFVLYAGLYCGLELFLLFSFTQHVLAFIGVDLNKKIIISKPIVIKISIDMLLCLWHKKICVRIFLYARCLI